MKASKISLQDFYRDPSFGGQTQNLMHTRTQRKGAVTPQVAEPDLPITVAGSLAEIWGSSVSL